jgi:hypothetical protein
MKENAKMEGQLSEEQLHMIVGGTGPAENCNLCIHRLHLYNAAKGLYEQHESLLDDAGLQGNVNAVHYHKEKADKFYNIAQQQHRDIIAHGHEGFPQPQNPPAGH